jgi:hypothetical protein
MARRRGQERLHWVRRARVTCSAGRDKAVADRWSAEYLVIGASRPGDDRRKAMIPRHPSLRFPALLLLASCDATSAPVEEGTGVTGELPLCVRHADCESDLCASEIGAAPETRSCIAEERILYVDAADCVPDGDGTRAEPLCQINPAIALADDERHFIRIDPAFYFPFSVSGKAIAIHGPDEGDETVEVTEEDISGSNVGDGSDVVLDGLAVGRFSRYGVRCTAGASGTSLEIRRSEVLSDIGVPLTVSACELRLDRALVEGFRGGMVLTDASYSVTNTIFTGTTEQASVVLDGGAGLFALNTVAGNGDPDVQPPAVECLTRSLLQDSIVADNVPAASGSQLAGNCRLRRVVIGASDPFPAAGAIRIDPELVDFRLTPSPANMDCCIDRAPRRRAIRYDFEGTPRQQGVRFDIGADELGPPADL